MPQLTASGNYRLRLRRASAAAAAAVHPDDGAALHPVAVAQPPLSVAGDDCLMQVICWPRGPMVPPPPPLFSLPLMRRGRYALTRTH